MRTSKYIFKINKNNSAKNMGEKRALDGVFYLQNCAGIFSYGNLAVRMLRKINTVIRKHIDPLALEVQMPLLQPMDLWKRSGRDSAYGDEMFRVKDRKDRDFCLAPTAEEAFVYFAEQFTAKRYNFPISLYQIGNKYRDELRPRDGINRGREFIMKDGYSFDVDKAGAINTYKKFLAAYTKIFNELGLEFWIVEANSGEVGGDLSHELVVASDMGDGHIYVADNYEHGEEERENLSFLSSRTPKDGFNKKVKVLEVGHVFYLGKKYSEAMDMQWPRNIQDDEQYLEMGCYGIGISRILGYLLDSKKFFPPTISPFKWAVIKTARWKDNNVCKIIEQNLSEALVFDRDVGFGHKKSDAELLGIPYQIILGNNIEMLDLYGGRNYTFDNIKQLLIHCRNYEKIVERGFWSTIDRELLANQ
jgi:prolyl-tRNA synthetase